MALLTCIAQVWDPDGPDSDDETDCDSDDETDCQSDSNAGRSVRRRRSDPAPVRRPSKRTDTPTRPRKQPATLARSAPSAPRKPRKTHTFTRDWALDLARPKPFVVSTANAPIILTADQLRQITAGLAGMSGVRDPKDPSKMLTREAAVIFNEGCALADKQHLIYSILQPVLTLLWAPAQSMKSPTPLLTMQLQEVVNRPALFIVALKQSGVLDVQGKLVKYGGESDDQAIDPAIEKAVMGVAHATLGARTQAVYVDGNANTWMTHFRKIDFLKKVRSCPLRAREETVTDPWDMRRWKMGGSSWWAQTTRTHCSRSSASTCLRTSQAHSSPSTRAIAHASTSSPCSSCRAEPSVRPGS